MDSLITLFPSLVYKSNINRLLSDDEKKLIQDKSLEIQNNKFNSSSVDNKILDNNNFKYINNFIQEKINFFLLKQ